MNTLLKPLSRLRDRWRDTLADDPWDGLESEIGLPLGPVASRPSAGALTDAEYEVMFSRIATAHFAVQSCPKPHHKTICLGREDDFTIL